MARLAVITLKAIFLMVTGLRKLKVESVLISNMFLLSKGLLVIHWRVKNALWVHVNGKWLGGQGNQTLIVVADETPVVSIRVQGLFSSYKRRWVISPQARLTVGEPRMSDLFKSLSAEKLCPVFLSDWSRSALVEGQKLAIEVSPVEFIIPSFQTENLYDTRLLHHS
jgi:hypothetical protein